jgi:hypothetical protein
VSNDTLSSCGCCEGVKLKTPASLENAPGLSALAYRVGTHGQFKSSMLASISSHRELDGLTTRADDDPSIALLDGWATVLDVLSFYQERIANEAYLRTATERRSLLELARSIGYELRPGVAASAYLAFTLDDVPQAPREATVPLGAKVQSIPAQDEKPQTFETVEELHARAEWNSMLPRLTLPVEIKGGLTNELFLKGTATALQPGDAILIVGDERDQKPTQYPFKEQWDVRVLQTVTADVNQGCTRVRWEDPLGAEPILPAAQNVKVFAFRQRAALFGNNAPDPRMLKLPDETQASLVSGSGANLIWNNFTIQNGVIDLDASYPKVVAGSWVALSTSTPPPGHPWSQGYVELYKVRQVSHLSRVDFALSSKITRIVPDTTEHLDKDWFKLQDTLVFAQSEELPIAEKPSTRTVWGQEIELDGLVPALERGRKIIVSGQRVYAKAKRAVNLQSAPIGIRKRFVKLPIKANADSASLLAGETIRITEKPTLEAPVHLKWDLVHETGEIVHVTLPLDALEFVKEETTTTELAEIDYFNRNADGRATLILKQPLQHSFDRASVRILGNVARATHGESKTEVLGNGDAGQVFQSFTLKQTPLTFVSASNASGTESTMEVRVNDMVWTESPSFYGLGPHDRCYVTRRADDGQVTVQFGDGLSGARPPTGVENINANYRVGLGLAGNLDASQLSLLMTRPLGVKSVTNPQPGIGGDNPEPRDAARQNAPLTVLTLDRIVSLQDFEDFARAFAGIGKAQAIWVWSGTQRVAFLTVAGAKGGELIETQPPLSNLIAAIDSAREPTQAVQVGVFTQLQFRLSAKVLLENGYLADKIYAAVTSALLDNFSFDQRGFGQAVTASEVLAVMQVVEGVKAVDLDTLHLTGNAAKWNPRLPANIARWDETEQQTLPSELLTIEETGIELKEMKP